MSHLHRFVLSLVGSVVLGMLAGCQAPGIEMPLGEERAPEQMGLRIEFNPGFVSRGILAKVPTHFGRAYADEGFLEFRIATVKNDGAEDVEFFPILKESPWEPAVTLHHRFWALIPRQVTMEGKIISLDAPLSAVFPGDSLSDYRADFEVEMGQVVFGSGVAKPFPEGWGKVLNPEGVRLRAGEIAEIRWKLRLKKGTPLAPTAPLGASMGLDGPGTAFYPPEIAATPAGVGRFERLIAHTIRVAPRQSFAARERGEDQIRPLYVDARFFRIEEITEDRLARILDTELKVNQPLESVRYRIPGLPILL